jgi:hypothetical protein
MPGNKVTNDYGHAHLRRKNDNFSISIQITAIYAEKINSYYVNTPGEEILLAGLSFFIVL